MGILVDDRGRAARMARRRRGPAEAVERRAYVAVLEGAPEELGTTLAEPDRVRDFPDSTDGR